MYKKKNNKWIESKEEKKKYNFIEDVSKILFANMILTSATQHLLREPKIAS